MKVRPDDTHSLLQSAPQGRTFARFCEEAVKVELGKPYDAAAFTPFVGVQEQLRKSFAARLVSLWPRQSGPDGDLVRDEMDRVVQVPGWKNVYTQPIINRIEMLSTGVRNDIGVKVFGRDLATIDRVSKEVAAALDPVPGAQGTLAWQIRGKDYLEITVDRTRAARYGVRVADVQDTIEVALGGRVVTQTVEDRDRLPVRIRYARARREDRRAPRPSAEDRSLARPPMTKSGTQRRATASAAGCWPWTPGPRPGGSAAALYCEARWRGESIRR